MMENWQLTLLILGSVFVGALIPIFVMIAIAVYRGSKEISNIGAQLARTMTHVETISDRIETLSLGLKGGETNVADVLTSVGAVARGLERNMKIINIVSAILTSVEPAIAAFIKTRFPTEETGKPRAPAVAAVPDNGHPVAPTVVSPKKTKDVA
jgi:hypothetical protein